MKAKGLRGILFLGLLAAGLAAPAAADEPSYLGHISLADIRNDGKDVMIFRENAVSGEPALLNMPLGPGDIVRTTDARRTEIQFDNGTLIRLDYDSELKIETILAPSLTSLENVSNAVLSKGRAYVMYTEYDRRELFQILTPSAALKMKNHTVAEISAAPEGGTSVRVSNGRVDVLFGPAAKKVEGEKVRAGESLVVTADGRLDRGALPASTDFEAWNKSLNEDFEKTHDGLTPLPKPIQKMPKAVFYFAQKYSTTYGEWIWDEYLGYVWRPNVNDRRYPWGSWSPYYAGQWAWRDGRMFWVAQEPWGWIPFHLGVWHWDKNKGWLWIPGSAFAPAWVTWNFYGGSAYWKPWTLWDWFFGDYGYPYWMRDMGFWYYWYGWGAGSWYYPSYYGYPYYMGPGPHKPGDVETVVTKINKDQLKGKAPKVVPVPKDLQGAYKGFLTALKRGDPRVVESFVRLQREGRPRTSPHLRFETPTRPAPARLESYPEARETVLRHAALPHPEARKGGRDAGVSFRFRDWNPDVKLAVRQGVAIRYDSRTNQVLCPQRGLSSNLVVSRGGDGRGSDGFVSSGSLSDGSSGTAMSSGSHGTSSASRGGTSSDRGSSSGGTKKD